jgi:acyl carrier protein
MHTKEAIFQQLQGVLNELFEIPAQEISLESNLYEDLDIDSIDAVDMAVKLTELTGQKIQPSDFRDIRTVSDVVEAVHALVQAEPAD